MDSSSSYFGLPLFTNLLILLVSARFLGEIFERFKQPAMIGEILAGIILGPSLLNIIHRTEEIGVISELGIFLLVIIAGLEINIEGVMKSIKGKKIIISITAFFIPLVSGFLVGVFWGLEAMTTIFIGLCIAITALPVTIRILMDLGKINSNTGQKIISVAILDDVLALTILGIILNVQNTDMTFVAIFKVTAMSLFKLCAFILILSSSYYLIKIISKKDNYIENNLNRILDFLKGKESLLAIFFAFILVFSTITELLGFHFIVGAFFGAMLISERVIGKENLKAIHTTTNGLAMGLLAPIFFAGIGLEFNFAAIQNYWLLATIILVSYISKVVGGYFGAKLVDLDNKVALTIGIALNSRGIMELVIANIAYNSGLINLEVFSILVIMGLLTTLTTPMALKHYFHDE